jgi:glycosyltransferase involved in cell wall biosynthesis
MAPELSVVIPVFGCSRQLDELYERLRAAIDPLTADFELVFVDDASRDGAWPRLVTLAETDPRVRVFGLSRNFGQDAAITAGLAKARGRWVVVMDCDLQEPPEAIPELYARAQEGFEVVRTERSARGHSRVRRLASGVYRRVLLEDTAHPEYSNMSLLSRRAVDAFNLMQDRDREYHLMLDWLGFDSAVVPIAFAQRDGDSSYTLRKLVHVALDGMFFRTTVLLRLVVFLGFLVAAVGGALALYNIAYYFAAGQPTGYTSLIVLVVLFSGLIIVSVGVVGLYVGRIFEQVKSRPLFVVARQIDRAEARPTAEPGPSEPEDSLEYPRSRSRD